MLYLQSVFEDGRVAQLVQSTWFTPRGSGVRIPSRPHHSQIPMHRIGIFSSVTSKKLFCKETEEKTAFVKQKGFVIAVVVSH